MTDNQKTDELKLNALADGELDEAERQALLEKVKNDPQLQGALCDIHLVKDMVKMAYPERPRYETESASRKKTVFSAMVASLVLLVAGFVSGNWVGQKNLFADAFQLSQIDAQTNKVVLFVGFSDKDRFKRVLDKAESLLKTYSHNNIQVDIVASSGGLDLFRTDTTPFAERLKTLAVTYDSLAFVACNNTLARLHSRGESVDVISSAVIAPSAVEFVVQRLQQGWSYIAI